MKQIQNQNATSVQTSLFCNNSYQRANFSYNGTSVEFRLTENVMLNAAQMAKPFGKKPTHWLRLDSTKAFLFALQKSKLQKSNLTEIQDNGKYQINSVYHSYYGGLVIGQHGGANPGTWMHEDVAIEFARWLNPKFAIWCNDRIKEILRGGNMPIPPKQTKVLAKDTKTSIVSDIKKHIGQSCEQINKFTVACSSNIDNVKCEEGIDNFYWSEKLSEKENTQKLLDTLEQNTRIAIFLSYQNRQLKRKESINEFQYIITSQQRTINRLTEMLYNKIK